MSTGLPSGITPLGTLLSFERPPAETLPRAPRWTLKTAQGQYGYLIVTRTFRRAGYHRQDVKGLRWMPWHQESMKDVDGCDKPR
jgi:hypothetical protein